VSLRYLQKVIKEFILGVRAAQCVGCGVVGAAHVAGMPRVPAAVELGRGFQNQHRRTAAPRANRRTERRITTADHQDIEFTVRECDGA
jgi:hypothetical protein